MGITVVSGASGFLGHYVTKALRAHGHDVRGLVRANCAGEGVEPRRISDLADRVGLRDALSGADTVVHLAARVHVMRDAATNPLAEFRRVNVEGTRILLEEAARAGVRRFLLMSSVKAIGEQSDTPWTEATPEHPVDPYGISKLEAEHLVRRNADAEGLHAPILRLPLVYGAGVRANFLQLMRLVDRGVPLPFGRIRNRRSLAFAGNVASAIVTALDSAAAARETLLLSDGEDVSTPQLVRAIAAALQRDARLVNIPDLVFRVAGRVGDMLSPVSPVTSASVHRLTGSLAVDSSRFRELTGFRTPFTLAHGMRETAAWYRSLAAAGNGA